MIIVYIIMFAQASLISASSVKNLSKRQDNGAFVPGSTIVTACAANEVECNDYCLDLAQGDVCCSEGCKSLPWRAFRNDGH
jgi:hypothetical protein